MWSVKEILSAVALIVASIIAIWAMLLPPQGEVDQRDLDKSHKSAESA